MDLIAHNHDNWIYAYMQKDATEIEVIEVGEDIFERVFLSLRSYSLDSANITAVATDLVYGEEGELETNLVLSVNNG